MARTPSPVRLRLSGQSSVAQRCTSAPVCQSAVTNHLRTRRFRSPKRKPIPSANDHRILSAFWAPNAELSEPYVGVVDDVGFVVFGPVVVAAGHDGLGVVSETD